MRKLNTKWIEQTHKFMEDFKWNYILNKPRHKGSKLLAMYIRWFSKVKMTLAIIVPWTDIIHHKKKKMLQPMFTSDLETIRSQINTNIKILILDEKKENLTINLLCKEFSINHPVRVVPHITEPIMPWGIFVLIVDCLSYKPKTCHSNEQND